MCWLASPRTRSTGLTNFCRGTGAPVGTRPAGRRDHRSVFTIGYVAKLIGAVPPSIPAVVVPNEGATLTANNHILPSVALRLLGRSPGVEWFEIAFIKGLSQRT